MAPRRSRLAASRSSAAAACRSGGSTRPDACRAAAGTGGWEGPGPVVEPSRRWLQGCSAMLLYTGHSL